MAVMAMAFTGLFKFLRPQLFPDISRTFKIGIPSQLPVGSSIIYPNQKVIVSRDSEGIAAMSLVCTHLGCIVTKLDRGFTCACHGTLFGEYGTVLKGPAPKPLPWFEVTLHPSGKLVVHADKVVPVGTRLAV